MPPDEPTEEERAEELPEDNGTPFQPADDTSDEFDDTHPVTDSGGDIQPEELYDEGVSGAVEASEPNAGNAVTDFNPPNQSDDDNDNPENGAMQPS